VFLFYVIYDDDHLQLNSDQICLLRSAMNIREKQQPLFVYMNLLCACIYSNNVCFLFCFFGHYYTNM